MSWKLRQKIIIKAENSARWLTGHSLLPWALPNLPGDTVFEILPATPLPRSTNCIIWASAKSAVRYSKKVPDYRWEICHFFAKFTREIKYGRYFQQPARAYCAEFLSISFWENFPFSPIQGFSIKCHEPTANSIVKGKTMATIRRGFGSK